MIASLERTSGHAAGPAAPAGTCACLYPLCLLPLVRACGWNQSLQTLINPCIICAGAWLWLALETSAHVCGNACGAFKEARKPAVPRHTYRQLPAGVLCLYKHVCLSAHVCMWVGVQARAGMHEHVPACLCVFIGLWPDFDVSAVTRLDIALRKYLWRISTFLNQMVTDGQAAGQP